MSDLILIATFSFVIHFDPDTDEPRKWLQDGSRCRALGEAIFAVPGFRQTLCWGQQNSRPLKRLNPKQAAGLLASTKELLVTFQDSQELRPALSVEVQTYGGCVNVRIQARNGAVTESFLEDVVALGCGLHGVLAGLAGLREGHVRVDSDQREFTYPRSRPPRENVNFPGRSIVTFLDRGLTKDKHPLGLAEEAILLTEPAPPARIDEYGDLMVVRWTSELTEEKLVAAAAAHDRWIRERVPTEVVDGYNQLGDQREQRGHAKPVEPLTLYSQRWKLGYQAVLVLPDGSVEREAWNIAREIARAGALPDGAAVESMRIVVPLREHVFMVADKAREAGFDAVLYADEDGAFWNPNP